jgi:DNA topoisomerase-6 subunit B
VYDVLKDMAQSHVSKKKRYDDEDAELLNKVSSRLITKETLREKLAQHVEQVSSHLV